MDKNVLLGAYTIQGGMKLCFFLPYSEDCITIDTNYYDLTLPTT